MLRGLRLQANQQADAVAVIDGARRLSFGELESLSNQLARRLMADGLAANGRQPVGFCCDGHWSIVIMFGIMKTGVRLSCTLPLLPRRRIDSCIDSCFHPQAIPTYHLTRGIRRTASSSWLQMRECNAS